MLPGAACRFVRISVILTAMLGCVYGVLASPAYFSPIALAAGADGKSLYVACSGTMDVLRLSTTDKKILASVRLAQPLTGLVLSRDGKMIFVTCGGIESDVWAIDAGLTNILFRCKAGYMANSPVPSPDGKRLYVCDQFDNDVRVIDLQTQKTTARIAVKREPVGAALTLDGRFLLVANALPAGRADAGVVGAVVSVIDTQLGCVVKELQLPNGSSSLHDIRVSPDGKYAVVAHILSRFTQPTTQLERGWMNTNAKSIIDLGVLEVLNTVLLDNVDSGAANPWGAAWSEDSRTVVITHAGSHEISIIDFQALLAKLAKLPAKLEKPVSGDDSSASHIRADVPNDLAFLVGARRRVKLPDGDRGPRAVVVIGHSAYVANYFSGTISAVDLAQERTSVESISLGSQPEPSLVRRGEAYFNDASICFQGWQSCASCHPGDARVDGLNWDLLNDGIGNPKNTKSLLLAHATPPSMSLGARDSAEAAVRAGIRHILFSSAADEVPSAIDAYLKSLKPEPSPYLVEGKLSVQAQRGEKIFKRSGCAECHPPGLRTDLHSYDVGTQGGFDQPTDCFDTPSLVELWRTAPYLHDGSAATVRELFVGRNPRNRHGTTTNLSEQQLDDLCAYLLSL